MSDKLEALLDNANLLLDEKNYTAVDALLSDSTLQRFPHPALYLFKCIARDSLDGEAKEILQLAEQGLALSSNYTGLIEFQFAKQMALQLYQEAAASSSLLCQMEPKNYNYYFWQADALDHLGAHSEAQASKANGHLQAALMLVERGALDEALKETENALQANNNLSQAHFLLGKIRFYQGDYSTAARILEPLSDNPQWQIDAWEIFAKMAEYQNDIDDLEAVSGKILAKVPNHPYALRSSAKGALARGDILPLFDALDKINEYHIDDIWSHLVRVSQAGQLSNNQNFLNSSHSTDLLLRLIEVFAETGMYKAALNRLQVVPIEDSCYLATVEKLAWQLWHYDEYQMMNTLVRSTLERHPPTAALYGFLARSVANLEGMQEGLEIIKQGDQLNAEDPTLGYFKASINADYYLNTNVRPFPDELVDELEQSLSVWLEIHPEDVYATYHMAGVLYSRGEFNKAKQFAEKAYKDGMTTSAFFYYWWARILLANNDTEEALEVFEDKFEKRSFEHSRMFEHYMTKAEIVAQLGDATKLQDTLGLMEQQWPDRIDNDYQTKVTAWRQQV